MEIKIYDPNCRQSFDSVHPYVLFCSTPASSTVLPVLPPAHCTDLGPRNPKPCHRTHPAPGASCSRHVGPRQARRQEAWRTVLHQVGCSGTVAQFYSKHINCFLTTATSSKLADHNRFTELIKKPKEVCNHGLKNNTRSSRF